MKTSTEVQAVLEGVVAKAPQASAAPAAGGSEVAFDFAQPWPANLPNAAGVLRILRGELPVPLALAAMSKAFRAAMSPLERAALTADGTLRTGILTRWRVEAAIQSRPPPEQSIDAKAAEALLVEVDAALDALRSSEDVSTPELKAVWEKTRVALVTDAVRLAELMQQVSQAEALQAAAKVSRKYEKSVGPRITAMSRVTSGPRLGALREKVLYASLAVAALLAVGYHGRGLLTPQVANPEVPLAVAGARVEGSTRGPLMVEAQGGKALDAAAVQELERQAAQLGREVREVGPGRYLVLPAGIAGGKRQEGPP